MFSAPLMLARLGAGGHLGQDEHRGAGQVPGVR
jgi:hypothetical protein